MLIAVTCGPADRSRAGQWQSLPAMPLGVFSAAASRSGNQIVITGGVDQLGQASRAVQVFDLCQQRWSLPLMLSPGRFSHAQVTLRDKRLFIVGGRTGQVARAQQALPSAQVLNLTGPVALSVPDLPKPLQRPTAHLLSDGRVVVIGGHLASIYDPIANQWWCHIPLWQRRRGHASTLIDNGQILVVAGTGRDSMELIDLAQRTSRMLAVRLPRKLDDLAVVALTRQRALVLGGQDSQTGDTTDQTWLIDLSDMDNPDIVPGPRLNIPGGVSDHCIAVLGSKLVIAGGESQRQGRDRELATVRLMDLDRMSVHRLQPMQSPHDDAVAIAASGSIIVLGGYRIGRPAMLGWPVPVASRQVEQLVPSTCAGAAHVD